MTTRSLGSSIPSPTAVQPARITGNELPDDVWRLIASYLSESLNNHDGKISRYISVNRTFFNFVLSAKYGEIRWFRLDGMFLRMLERLQEPLIAGYVRKLNIRAWFVNFLFKREELLLSPDRRRNWERAGISPLARFMKGLLGQTRIVREESGVVFEKSFAAGKLVQTSSSNTVVRMLVQAVSGMKNVTEFNFEWRDLLLNKQTSIFLTSARLAFDTSLRKLVLRAQIPKFKELLAITNFNNIDELNLHFDYRPQSGKHGKDAGKNLANSNAGTPAVAAKDPDVEDLHNTVIPFIAHRKARLHTLSISSSAAVDLSQFFSALPAFNALRRLYIHISFETHALSDPAGLIRVLQNGKSTVSHVYFEVLWPDSDGERPFSRADTLQRKRASWAGMNTQLLGVRPCLSGLESLRIPFVSLEETMPIIKRSCDTLKRLGLADHFLSLQEVNVLAGIFAHRSFELKHLYIEVGLLNFELVKVLASRFPGLNSLVLVYHSFECPSYDALIEHTSIPEWKLTDVQVYYERPQIEYDEHGVLRHVSFYALDEISIESRISSWVPTLRDTKGGVRSPISF